MGAKHIVGVSVAQVQKQVCFVRFQRFQDEIAEPGAICRIVSMIR